MSQLRGKSSHKIEDISNAINKTIKKYNELKFDKDLSVIDSIENESKEFDKKDDAKHKKVSDKEMDNHDKIDTIKNWDPRYDFEDNNKSINFAKGEKEKEKEIMNKKEHNTLTTNYNSDYYIDSGRTKNIFLKNSAEDTSHNQGLKAYNYKYFLNENYEKNNNNSNDINRLNIYNDKSLELNESTQILIKQNSMNNTNLFSNNEINKNINMNNNENKITRNNDCNFINGDSKSHLGNNVVNKNSFFQFSGSSNNSNNSYNNILANSTFKVNVDKIYSCLEDFQKNMEKDFAEIENIIDNLIEKDLKLLK